MSNPVNFLAMEARHPQPCFEHETSSWAMRPHFLRIAALLLNVLLWVACIAGPSRLFIH